MISGRYPAGGCDRHHNLPLGVPWVTSTLRCMNWCGPTVKRTCLAAIRWGADASSDVLRRSVRCSACRTARGEPPASQLGGRAYWVGAVPAIVKPCSFISTMIATKVAPGAHAIIILDRAAGTAPRNSGFRPPSRSCATATLTRTQQPREHMAVHASELAVKPHLQIF
jgi:hypothetical protein